MQEQSLDLLVRHRDVFYDEAGKKLRELGLVPSLCLKQLELAAQRYNTNVLREATSVTDARLLRELAETIELSDNRIARRVGIW